MSGRILEQMPFDVQYSADGAGVLPRATGLLTADELLAGTVGIGQAGDRLSRVRYALVDLSGVVEFRGTSQDLSKLADEDVAMAKQLPNLAIVVVASLPVMFGMARMWEALAHQTGWRIMTVQTREDAIDWLGREVPGVTVS